MFALNLLVSSCARAVASAPVTPTTINFTSAQFSPGFAGSISLTKNAARIYARGALTLWCGFITGSEAKLTNPSDFGDNAGSMEVSIDNAPFTAAANTGSVYTLFTGLVHATRFVQIRWVQAMADAPYIAATGNVLSVTGAPPALIAAQNWIQAGSNSSTGLYSAGVVPNNSGFIPPLQAPAGQVYGTNVGSVKIRGAFTKIVATGRLIGVSKNGGPPSYYSIAEESNNPPAALVIPCDGSVATYNVWDNGNYKELGGHFSVSGNSTLLDIGIIRKLDQFGDSITAGAPPVQTETMRVAAALGFVGSTAGRAGETITGMKGILDNILPLKTVTSDDVAILAIGGNSLTGGIDSTERADYLECINKLVAKGYGKIICRGILPATDGSNLWTTENGVLQSVVTELGNSNVVFLNTSTWLGYATSDGVHPTDPGYATLATFALPAYTSILGL